METFDFFWGLILGELLFRHSDNLSRALQRKDISASEGQLIAKKTVITIQSIRTDECFQLFWDKVLKMTEGKGINGPVLPRKRKRPKRYEDGEATNEYDETPFLMYR